MNLFPLPINRQRGSDSVIVACLVLAIMWVHALPLQGQDSTTHADRLLRELNSPNSRYIFVAAHRGGFERDWENRAPENSLANIEKAVRMGFDVFETDLRQSKDGQFVIMHDGTVDRTTDGHGRVLDLTLAELQDLRLKYTNGELSTESVPTFEEFLASGKGRILFQVDYRAPLENLPAAVRHVERHGMLGYVFFRFPWSDELAEQISQLIDAGMPSHLSLIMFRTRTPAQVQAAIARFNPSIIYIFLPEQEITPESREALRLARDAGVLVETHSWRGEREWDELIAAGFRMFDTRQPEAMIAYLRTRDAHW